MVQSNPKDSEQRLQSEHVATEVNRWFSRTGWCRFNHVKFVRLNFCPLIASHIPIEPLKSIWYVYNCIINIYIYIYSIWNTVIHCEFMTSSHNVPSRSRKHFHLVFGIPRPLPHCPPSSNTAPDEPSPQGSKIDDYHDWQFAHRAVCTRQGCFLQRWTTPPKISNADFKCRHLQVQADMDSVPMLQNTLGCISLMKFKKDIKFEVFFAKPKEANTAPFL